MNWKQLMSELAERMTLQEIADQGGLASRGHAHDLMNGNQKSVRYATGVLLVALHKKVMRRKK